MTYKKYLFYKAEIATNGSGDSVFLTPTIGYGWDASIQFYLEDHTEGKIYNLTHEPYDSVTSYLRTAHLPYSFYIMAYTDSLTFCRNDIEGTHTYSLYYNTDNYSDEDKNYVLYQDNIGVDTGGDIQLYRPMRKISLRELQNNIASPGCVSYYLPSNAVIELEDGTTVSPIISQPEDPNSYEGNTYTLITANINNESVTFYDSRGYGDGTTSMYSNESTGDVIVSIYTKEALNKIQKVYPLYRYNCRGNVESELLTANYDLHLNRADYRAILNGVDYECTITFTNDGDGTSSTLNVDCITIYCNATGGTYYTNTSNEDILVTIYYYQENAPFEDSVNEDDRIYWSGSYDTDMFYTVPIKHMTASDLSRIFNGFGFYISINLDNAHVDYNGVYVLPSHHPLNTIMSIIV